MRSTGPVVIAGAVLWAVQAGCGPSEPEIEIRSVVHPPAGKTVQVRWVEKRTESRTRVDAPGAPVFQELERELVYAETTLEAGEPRPVRSRLAFDKARASYKGKSGALPYEKRTVRVERNAGRYSVVAEGAPLLGPEALEDLEAALNPAVDPETLLLAAGPVRIGQSRPVSVESAHKAFLSPAEIDTGASRAECRLVRVYDKDGAKFGVLELRVDLAVRTWPGSEFRPPGVFTVEIVRDGCIDGSSPAASLTMKAGLTGTAVVSGKTAQGKKALETHDVKVLWSRTVDRSAAQ